MIVDTWDYVEVIEVAVVTGDSDAGDSVSDGMSHSWNTGGNSMSDI